MLFQVLGPVAVLDGGRTVNLGGPQQRRLLAVLLVEPGRTVHNERLLEVLWPDAEPESGLRTIRTYVSRLRTAIGDGYVRTTAVGYEIELDGAVVDAKRFGDLLANARQSRPLTALSLLDEALALWRGPALGDFGSEWWAVPFVRKYEELRLTALADRIDAMAARGWEAGALAEVAGLVSEHPLHEPFVERLMRGLQATGRHAEALRAFQEYRYKLGEETGVEPSAELTALERFVAAASASTDASIGPHALRGYTIHEPIGAGQFGAVYRATQPGLDRDVALKVIRPELASSRAFIQRFEVEAQFVAMLEHPNIVPLYDYWRDPSGAFLVFRLLRGRSAADRLATRGPLAIEAVTTVVNQIGGALAAAHLRGVAHRDVKPANILFDESDIAYLSDFGIARIDEHSLQRETDHRSARYAAGAALMSDAPLDQYLLAATAWELLAGRAPFERTSASISGQTRHEAIPPITDIRPDIPCRVSDVLCRAGAADDSTRFAGISEFVEAWNSAVLDDVPASRSGIGPVSGINPYCGLRAFGEADAFYFQGRSSLTDELEAMVRRARFVTVVGPSGSGKSSLVRAGLIPRMRRDGSLVVTLVPGAEPMSALSDAALAVASRENADRLLPTAIAEPGGLRRALRVLGGSADLTIVLDQFEELWTLATSTRREQFLEGLLDAVMAEGVRVVATVRADLYGLALAHSRLGPVVAAATFPVTPMSAAELHDAIALPAARVGVTVDERLASALAAEVLDRPGSLPLLEFTLAELYERRDVNIITERQYDDLGGLRGSVGREAERIFERCSPADQAATRAMFERLVTVSEAGGQAVRRPARRTELAGVPDSVIDAFVDRRLLVSDRDRETREPTVELAHEIILTAWPRLQDWLDSDREWLTSLRAIRDGAAAWDRSGRDEGELLRGARLDAVTEQLDRRRDRITATEADYVDASCTRAELDRTAVERQLATQLRANRRLRRSLIAVGLVLVAALVASILAVTQRRHAQAARRDALVTTLEGRSLALRSNQRDVAALLAVEAAERRPDERWPSALLGTFTNDPGFLGYIDFGSEQSVNGAVVPGTSKAVVGPIPRTLGADNEPLRTIDLVTGEQGPLFEPMGPHDHGEFGVAVSGDGRRVAQFGYQYVDREWQAPTLHVYDTGSGRKVGSPIVLSDDPDTINVAIALNADGSQVAVSIGERGDTRIFDTGNGSLLATVSAASDALVSLRGKDSAAAAWSPDGRLFVGSSGTHLRVFDPETFEATADFTVPRIATGGVLKFSEDGSVLVARGVNVDPETFDQSGVVVRIDPRTGKVAWTIDSDEFRFGLCDSLAFSVTEDRLWCGDYFGTIRGRSLSTGALDGTRIAHQRGWLSSLDMATIDGGRYLVSMGRNSAIVGRWRIDGLGPVQRRIADGYDFMQYSPDGSTALVSGPDDSSPNGWKAAVWDPVSDRQVVPLGTDFVDAGWVGPGRIATVADDGSVNLVSVPTGAVQHTALDVDPDRVMLSFLPNGWIASGYADGRVVLQGIDDGSVATMRLTNPSGTFQPMAISVALTPDEATVYVGAQGAWAFDRATGRQLATNDDTQIGALFTNGDGALVATLFDGTIELLDPDLHVMASAPAARGWVSDVQFSDDGALMAARGNDETVSLYDVASQQRIGDPITIPENASIDLNPQGTELSIAGPDDVVIWSLDRAVWIDAACRIADRNLSDAERDTYLAGLDSDVATCETVD